MNMAIALPPVELAARLGSAVFQPLLHRGGRSEPSVQRVGQPDVCSVSDPGDVAVWANQHCAGGADHAEYRELPVPLEARIYPLDSVCPGLHVEVAGLPE